jgi:hypothetical protein
VAVKPGLFIFNRKNHEKTIATYSVTGLSLGRRFAGRVEAGRVINLCGDIYRGRATEERSIQEGAVLQASPRRDANAPGEAGKKSLQRNLSNQILAKRKDHNEADQPGKNSLDRLRVSKVQIRSANYKDYVCFGRDYS